MAERAAEPLLGPFELAELRTIGVAKRFAVGDRLISVGSASTEVFYMLTGRAKIVVLSDTGQESVFGLRSPGEFVGEMSTLNDDRRSADVVAIEPIEAVVVSASRFIDFLHRFPTVTLALLRMQSRRLHQMTVRSLMGSRSVKARVASRLLELSGADHHCSASTPLTVRVLQADLAKWVDATREWTTRALGELREAGLIETGRGSIVILDIGGLRAAGADRAPSSPL